MIPSEKEIEKRREYGRAWREKNKEKIKQYKENNKEKIYEKEKEYRKKNRARRTRQFRNLRVGGMLDIIIKKQGNKCWFCDKDLSKIPESKKSIHHRDGIGFKNNGYNINNDLKNLALMCVRCHQKFHILAKQYLKGKLRNAIGQEST